MELLWGPLTNAAQGTTYELIWTPNEGTPSYMMTDNTVTLSGLIPGREYCFFICALSMGTRTTGARICKRTSKSIMNFACY